MRLYATTGQRQKALLQYERLRQALSEVFQTEPDAETRRLHQENQADRFTRVRPRSGSRLPEEGARHNLPNAPSSFVGREREVVEVKRSLAMTQVLTLTGTGGAGKTRLALEVASDLVGAYPDGTWLVELAPLSDPVLAPQAVAAALGVREQPGRSLTDALADNLRTKDLLLVLDNCEHLVDAAARLANTPISGRHSIGRWARTPTKVPQR